MRKRVPAPLACWVAAALSAILLVAAVNLALPVPKVTAASVLATLPAKRTDGGLLVLFVGTSLTKYAVGDPAAWEAQLSAIAGRPVQVMVFAAFGSGISIQSLGKDIEKLGRFAPDLTIIQQEMFRPETDISFWNVALWPGNARAAITRWPGFHFLKKGPEDEAERLPGGKPAPARGRPQDQYLGYKTMFDHAEVPQDAVDFIRAAHGRKGTLVLALNRSPALEKHIAAYVANWRRSTLLAFTTRQGLGLLDTGPVGDDADYVDLAHLGPSGQDKFRATVLPVLAAALTGTP